LHLSRPTHGDHIEMSSRRPLHVALVAPSLRILGGQAVQAQRLLDAWRQDADVEAWLVPINPVPPPPFDRLLRVKYLRTLLTQALYYPLLLRELRRADVVHVFSAAYASFLLAPLPAILVARLYGKPVVLNYRSGEAPDHLRRSALARRTLKSVDLNVVPSSFLNQVFARFGISSRVVANVCEGARFQYCERDPLRPRLLSTRNFEPLYNVGCTLRAFARVQRQYPDASLILVGSGSTEPALREQVRELGLQHVTFAGRVAHADIHRCYADADIYVQTPSIDNMPASVIEAFASGLPVVATRVGGVPAILEDGVHGLLAPDDDPDAVADRIIELLQDPERARRMAAAARASCQQYDWTVLRDEWIAVYRSVAARGGSATLVEAA
jgi:glycosyltransferase involved in cell wall biosynthesis